VRGRSRTGGDEKGTVAFRGTNSRPAVRPVMRRDGTSSPNIRLRSGFLVYFLVLLTFRTPGMCSPVMNGERHDDARTGPRRLIAFFAAILFVSHPIETHAVPYVMQRLASPDRLFYLAAAVSYAGSRLAAMHRRPVAACCLYGPALSSTVLAMKTKGISFALSIIVALYEHLFFDGTSGSRAARLARLVPLVCVRKSIEICEVKIETSYIDGNCSSHFDPVLDSVRICRVLLRFGTS